MIDVIEKAGIYNISGLIDAYREVGEETLGYKVVGKESDLPTLIKKYNVYGCIIAVGDNYVRFKIVENIKKISPELKFVNAIHPNSSIARDVTIDEGSVVMSGVTINPCCKIGKFTILNTHSSLDHDSSLGDFASIAPRATTGGNCHIGNHSAISIGVTLIHNIKVGENSVVGAGSLVLKDVESYSITYGIPAKKISARVAGEKYL